LKKETFAYVVVRAVGLEDLERVHVDRAVERLDGEIGPADDVVAPLPRRRVHLRRRGRRRDREEEGGEVGVGAVEAREVVRVLLAEAAVDASVATSPAPAAPAARGARPAQLSIRGRRVGRG